MFAWANLYGAGELLERMQHVDYVLEGGLDIVRDAGYPLEQEPWVCALGCYHTAVNALLKCEGIPQQLLEGAFHCRSHFYRVCLELRAQDALPDASLTLGYVRETAAAMFTLVDWCNEGEEICLGVYLCENLISKLNQHVLQLKQVH